MSHKSFTVESLVLTIATEKVSKNIVENDHHFLLFLLLVFYFLTFPTSLSDSHLFLSSAEAFNLNKSQILSFGIVNRNRCWHTWYRCDKRKKSVYCLTSLHPRVGPGRIFVSSPLYQRFTMR